MFIINNTPNHLNEIFDNFEDADEVIIAVGFLSYSGINFLLEAIEDFCYQPDSKITIYAGANLATEGKGLKKILTLFNKSKSHKLILCNPKAGIFHPKIYAFRKGKRVKIIVGSANLTRSGLELNDELSYQFKTKTDSKDYKQFLKYFQDLDKKYDKPNNEERIREFIEYVSDFNKEQTSHNKFSFRPKDDYQNGIYIPAIIEWYEKYCNSAAFIEPLDREKKYQKAKKLLFKLTSDKKITSDEFENILGQLVGFKGYEKLWHSGSIHRKSKATLNYQKGFRNLVQEIKLNISNSVEKTFQNSIDSLKRMKKAGEIKGIGVNIIAEILMTFAPQKFANLNKNPLTALDYFGKDLKRAGIFKGIDYKNYVELLHFIKDQLGVKSFLEVDSFFNYIYWND